MFIDVWEVSGENYDLFFRRRTCSLDRFYQPFLGSQTWFFLKQQCNQCIKTFYWSYETALTNDLNFKFLIGGSDITDDTPKIGKFFWTKAFLRSGDQMEWEYRW